MKTSTRVASITLVSLAALGVGAVQLSARKADPRPPAGEAPRRQARPRAPAAETAAATSATPAAPRASAHVAKAARAAPAATSDARAAIVKELEASLGATVHARWDSKGKPGPRSLRFQHAPAFDGTPFEAARSVLEKVTGALGDRCAIVAEGEPVPPTGRALVASKPIAAGPSLIIVFQAFADGLPISDGAVKVELRRTKAGLVPVSVVGRFHPAARVSGTVSPQVETALERSYPSVRGSGFELRPARRLVAHEVAGGEHRRAFEVTASTSLTSAERSFVDAETGEVLLSYPLTCEGTAHALAYETDPGHGDRQALPLGGLYVSKGRKRVVTRDDGAFSLKGTVSLAEGFSGPRVRVVPDGERAFSYEGPADFTLLGSASSSRTWHEDEAAAFYHAMSYNSYMTETYPDVTEAARVRFAIVVASSFENAFFSPTTVETDDGESFPGYVDLGTIARHSLARDGSVVKHEYTHALLNGVAYLYGNDEASGVNEGLADYFPCAQAESPRIGTWAHAPYVRALDDKPHKLVWPRDAERAGYEVHRIGNIFNQALWQARTAAERAGRGERLRVDQAVFGGVLRMPSSPSLLDAREAILAADEAENDSAHVRLLEDAFLDHGIAAAD